MIQPHLDLLLFTTDTEFAVAAASSGVDGFIVDWETKGKTDRQRGQDMEINADTVDDLARLSGSVALPITVRINGIEHEAASEIELALANGANGIMLPMARTAADVAHFLDLIDGRAKTIVQIETQDLVNDLASMARLPWDAAYIGLHDLMLSRGAASMWQALVDGTVESIFETLSGRDVGFAGATVVGGGHPIRFTQVLQELARMGPALTFLRRSFRREIQDRDMPEEINALRAAWRACHFRGPAAVESDRCRLFSDLRRLIEF